jgi:hypothetical protein
VCVYVCVIPTTYAHTFREREKMSRTRFSFPSCHIPRASLPFLTRRDDARNCVSSKRQCSGGKNPKNSKSALLLTHY